MGYLFTFLKPQHAYYANWQELRRRQKAWWIGLALFVPTIGLGSMMLMPLAGWLHSEIPVFIYWVLVVAALMTVRLRLGRWPCPRCGRPFALTLFGKTNSIANDNCMSCGLPRYAPCDPKDQQWESESHMF